MYDDTSNWKRTWLMILGRNLQNTPNEDELAISYRMRYQKNPQTERVKRHITPNIDYHCAQSKSNISTLTATG